MCVDDANSCCRLKTDMLAGSTRRQHPSPLAAAAGPRQKPASRSLSVRRVSLPPAALTAMLARRWCLLDFLLSHHWVPGRRALPDKRTRAPEHCAAKAQFFQHSSEVLTLTHTAVKWLCRHIFCSFMVFADCGHWTMRIFVWGRKFTNDDEAKKGCKKLEYAQDVRCLEVPGTGPGNSHTLSRLRLVSVIDVWKLNAHFRDHDCYKYYYYYYYYYKRDTWPNMQLQVRVTQSGRKVCSIWTKSSNDDKYVLFINFIYLSVYPCR